MSGIVLAAGVLALLLTIYLFVSLFKPEAFE
jgi:K+-transporting ATPase KdpF subunit